MENLQYLLNEVIKKTDALKTAQSLYSRQLAPKFNTFDFINTDELGLSRILADLLNPKGSHDQQEGFLRLFIKHCFPSIDIDSKWSPFIKHLSQTRVVLEEITWKSGTRRRMDIYLECKADDKSYGICIENKPSAADQPNQLIDYYSELEARGHTNLQIVYLNESEEGPCEHSVDTETLNGWIENKQYSHLRFSDLVSWLKACQVNCQNHSVNEFLAQLIKFIQKQFMGIEDMNEDIAVLEVMQQSEENIEASIQISNNVDKMKKQLIQKLIRDIKTEFSNNYGKKSYQLDISHIGEGKNYEQINLKSSNFNKGYICFEFQSANFNSPCLGLKFNSRAEVKSCLNAENFKIVLNENLTGGKVGSSPLWPAYYYFDPENWKTSSKAWSMIRSGEMAIKILKEMDKIFDILNTNGCFED